MKKLIKKTKNHLREIFVERPMQRRLTNDAFTLIASDCTGGMMYHTPGREFLSPTINLYFSAPDYVKFIQNMEHYLDAPWKEIKIPGEDWPCAKVDDITLHLVHYQSFEEAREKWNQRKTRIRKDSIYYIMNDRNGCTQQEVEAFANFPAEHKLFYTAKGSWNIKPKALCLAHVHRGGDTVEIMTKYKSIFSLRRNMECFDYVGWLNSN